MPDSLLKQYERLTNELIALTAKRNEVGEKLKAAMKDEELARKQAEERQVTQALIDLAQGEDLSLCAKRIGVEDWRLTELFHNTIRKVRKANPEVEHLIPTRISSRTLIDAELWLPYVKKYMATLR